ncbi:SafA/ExsA family spore coat assembly protein [Bacillus kwashiorkori]|uniref:SafA/ExsA family spore coat assembly protein n=1 Tax=Bacillus kwashiorkori TaxID=1522318 RepID=UPI000785ED44|nr:SafA/ExsA family spore coat assembly protein [Bacillus kwashiorkori]
MKIHIVQKGDTLWKIAQKYGVNFEQLKSANTQLSNPDMLMPGMKIKIPTSSGTIKKEQPIYKKEMPMKEMPLAEHPFAQEKPMEIPVQKEQPIMQPPKEVIKEVPKPIYVPKIPQPIIPEIDVNNYYMVNMAKMNIDQHPVQQIQPQQIEEESPESPESPMDIPISVQQPAQHPMMMPMYHSPCVPISPVLPGSGLPCFPIHPCSMPIVPLSMPNYFPPFSQTMPQAGGMVGPIEQPQQPMPTVQPEQTMEQQPMQIGMISPTLIQSNQLMPQQMPMDTMGNMQQMSMPMDTMGNMQQMSMPMDTMGNMQQMSMPMDMMGNMQQMSMPMDSMDNMTNGDDMGQMSPTMGQMPMTMGNPFPQTGQMMNSNPAGMAVPPFSQYGQTYPDMDESPETGEMNMSWSPEQGMYNPQGQMYYQNMPLGQQMGPMVQPPQFATQWTPQTGMMPMGEQDCGCSSSQPTYGGMTGMPPMMQPTMPGSFGPMSGASPFSGFPSSPWGMTSPYNYPQTGFQQPMREDLLDEESSDDY